MFRKMYNCVIFFRFLNKFPVLFDMLDDESCFFINETLYTETLSLTCLMILFYGVLHYLDRIYKLMNVFEEFLEDYMSNEIIDIVSASMVLFG